MQWPYAATHHENTYFLFESMSADSSSQGVRNRLGVTAKAVDC